MPFWGKYKVRAWSGTTLSEPKDPDRPFTLAEEGHRHQKNRTFWSYCTWQKQTRTVTSSFLSGPKIISAFREKQASSNRKTSWRTSKLFFLHSTPPPKEDMVLFWAMVGFQLFPFDAVFGNLNETCSICPSYPSGKWVSICTLSCPLQQGEDDVTT